jgi:hypothetical protein
MKINKLDAHDRLDHFQKQSLDISECCEDLVKKRPFGDHPFYIFAHARTEDNDPSKKRLIWQPRLTKPKAQTNSMLFKAYPGTDMIKLIWMIPDRAMWEQYKKGNLTESQIISESLHDFEHNRAKLEAREDDDLSDKEIDAIYESLSLDAKWKKQGFMKI